MLSHFFEKQRQSGNSWP